MTARIGIFAGTFDPVHDGHLAFARAALDAGVEKVMFLPEPRPYRKQGIHALEHRLAMVHLAVAQEPRFGVIQLEQARLTPRETIPVLQERFKGFELALLFGDDVIGYMASHIAAWPHIEDLARSCSLIIASRYENQADLVEKLQVMKQKYKLPFQYQFVEPAQETISSSRIRLAIKRGELAKGLPAEVASYIAQNGLYAAGEMTS